MSRKRQGGHYCWSCDRMRANEKFSGRGHAQHLCKDCARLGEEELAYRQALRNLERLVTWEGIVPRKKREQFRRYLNHKEERVRAYARQIETTDRLERAKQRLHEDVDEWRGELAAEEDIFPAKAASSPNRSLDDDTKIPF